MYIIRYKLFYKGFKTIRPTKRHRNVSTIYEVEKFRFDDL